MISMNITFIEYIFFVSYVSIWSTVYKYIYVYVFFKYLDVENRLGDIYWSSDWINECGFVLSLSLRSFPSFFLWNSSKIGQSN